jgi:PIN domain nuclease of toxin-antitoxin system
MDRKCGDPVDVTTSARYQCGDLAVAQRLKASASEKLDEAARGPGDHLSPITAWEAGLQVSRNRLSLGTTPQR